MGYIQLAVYAFQIIFRVWDAIHNHNEEVRQAKMDALKEALDAVHSRDTSAVNLAIGRFDRL